jgi:hypothetical protein
MQAILNYLEHKATWRNILLLFAGYLVFPLYLLPSIIDEGTTGPFDLLLYYNSGQVYEMLAAYGERLRSRYIWGLFTVDLIYPFYYSIFIAMIMAALLKKVASDSRTLTVFMCLPFTVLVADLIENAMLISLLSNYPEKLPLISVLVGYVTCIKWLLFLFTMLGIVIILFAVFKQRAKLKKTN